MSNFFNNCPVCDCDSSIANTGTGCQSDFERPALIVALPTRDSLGNFNGIPIGTTIDDAFITTMLNEPDQSKRWRPTPQFTNPDDVRAEAKFWASDTGDEFFLYEGARKFSGLIMGAGKGTNSPQMKQILESIRCEDTAIFLITHGRQIIGKFSNDGQIFLPRQINEKSVYAGFVHSKADMSQHLAFSFSYSALEKDESIRAIDCSQIGTDILSMRGLLDVCAEVLESTEEYLKIKLVTKFGAFGTPVIVPGLVAADFVSSSTGTPANVYNVTDNADVTITVTETPDGTYELTYAQSQTSLDVIHVKVVKNGFDFTCVLAQPVEVPN